MLGLGRKTKRSESCDIEVFIDFETFDKFKHYAKKNKLNESKALVEILQSGMNNYWLLEYKRLKENYRLIKQLFYEYKRDNEILTRLEQENEDLKKILGRRGKSETHPRISSALKEM